tara:strand:+ start:216 stop:782 length:567 start_codon:yes stop_codon:yes gene_type:complete
MKQNIYLKLFNLQNELGAISKDAKNPFYKSKYFDINSLIGQLKPLLQKYELVLLQPLTDGYVRSVIHDLDGGAVESSIKLPKNLDAQKLGSAITYFRRYTLQSLLALQAVDDDANLASQGIVPFQSQESYKIKKKSKPVLKEYGSNGENTPEFKNAFAAMKEGKTIYDIKEHYKINKEIEIKLLNFKI